MPHPSKMSATDAALLVIDVQQKLMPSIRDAAAVTRNITFLVDAAKILHVPVQATEQYPKGLGPTVTELAERLPVRPDKVVFSSCAVPGVVENFRLAGRSKIVLAGLETHVCVLQTALDLLALGFQVYVAADAVSNRFAVDHEYALRRMEQAGAILTTAETVAFEWVGTAGTPAFKEISRLVQERMQQMRL